MIPKTRLILLGFCLTIGLLAACEPLAPDEQTPQVIVVTGETPESAGIVTSGPTMTSEVSGVVNTPVPSATSVPPPTALPSATPYACSESRGRVLQSEIFSAITGANVPYRIYLPPCFYDTFRRYPYVILLHGTGFTDSMWADLGAVDNLDQGITLGTLPPMVLVMPDGGVLAEYNDLPEGQSWEDVILNELIPTVETDFCLWGSRAGRAIGGISRGGFWAFSIGLRHPEVFSALGGHSPHFEESNASPDHNPLYLASRVNLSLYPLRGYMDNGANDYVGTNAIRMSDLLRENGIDHQYLINPTGEHTQEYWSEHMADYLAFYGLMWPLDPLALPSCLEPIQ